MADTTSPPGTEDDARPEDATDAPNPVRFGLTRSGDGRLIAGVAHGLAATWGFRPWLVRLGFVVATAFAGLGLVLYVAGWLVIPEEGQTDSIAQRMVRRMNLQSSWVGFGLLLIGGIIVGTVADIDLGILIAGALLVTGYALYRGDLLDVREADGDDGGSVPPVYQRAVRPRPVRPKSYLGRLTVGATLVTLGVMGSFDALGISHPTSRHYAAAAILVIGLGLAVGTLYGRSRGLVALGLLLLPVMAVAAIADHHFGANWQSISLRHDSIDDLEAAYRLPLGDIYIDLTRTDFAGRTATLDLDVGIGNITVQVPPDVAIDGSGSAILGEVRVAGRNSAGFGASTARTTEGSAGRLVVDADVRIGMVEIYTDGSPSVDLRSEPGLLRIPPEINSATPSRVGEVAAAYEIQGGQFILDLTSVTRPNATVPVTITGHGSVWVIVPPRAEVVVASSLPIVSELPGANLDAESQALTRSGPGVTIVVNATGVNLTIQEAQ